MIAALILCVWVAFCCGALSLAWTAKRADEAIEAHAEPSLEDELDEMVWEFGGGWKAS